MRKRSAYRPRPLMGWLSARERTEIEILAHYFAPKLAAGLFSDEDGNTLAYLVNLARKVAIEADYRPMLDTIDCAMQALVSVRVRREKIGRWGASGPELQILEEHLPNIARWLLQQPVHRLREAREWVLHANHKLRQAGVLYADMTDTYGMSNTVKLPNVQAQARTEDAEDAEGAVGGCSESPGAEC